MVSLCKKIKLNKALNFPKSGRFRGNIPNEKSLKITDEQLETLLQENYSYSFGLNQSYDTSSLREMLQTHTPEERAKLVLGFIEDTENNGHGFCTFLLGKKANKKILLENHEEFLDKSSRDKSGIIKFKYDDANWGDFKQKVNAEVIFSFFDSKTLRNIGCTTKNSYNIQKEIEEVRSKKGMKFK